MKKLVAAMLCATGCLGGIGFTPTTPQTASRTPITALTPSGSFTGEIAVDANTQTVHLEGALTAKGHTYQVEASGTVATEKLEGRSVYAISGTETIIDPTASIAGNMNVNASSDTLSNAVTTFANKVIKIRLPQ